MPSGAKAQERSTNYGTAEAVPFQDRFLTQTLQPLPWQVGSQDEFRSGGPRVGTR
jgi:hypothetical protein